MMEPNVRGERFSLFHVPGLVISVDHQTSLTSSFGRFSDVLYAYLCELSGEYRLVGRREGEEGNERKNGRSG
jgi:hypothetical protein